ncbi:MAG: hypothetical protein JNK12_23470 [Acidimicrobiales bacterium]|nr:hypothetical protein [Acidimicrobiales bacterium]
MPAVHATIARHPFDLTTSQVERALEGVAPEPLRDHYAIVNGRRYPPKQVIAVVTGLDRSAFITTQARSVLERLHFTVGRVGSPPTVSASPAPTAAADERLAAEADLLRPYRGEHVAVDRDWTEVLASGPDPHAVRRALKAMGLRGTIFRVPEDPGNDIGAFGW